MPNPCEMYSRCQRPMQWPCAWGRTDGGIGRNLDVGSGELVDGASPERGQRFAAHDPRVSHLRYRLPVGTIVPQNSTANAAIVIRSGFGGGVSRPRERRPPAPSAPPSSPRSRTRHRPARGSPATASAPVDHDEPSADPAAFAHPQAEAGKLGIDEDAVGRSRRKSPSGEVARAAQCWVQDRRAAGGFAMATLLNRLESWVQDRQRGPSNCAHLLQNSNELASLFFLLAQRRVERAARSWRSGLANRPTAL